MSVANEIAGGPVVLYLASAIPDRSLLEQKIHALAERGYRLIFCPDATALLQLAQTRGRYAGSVCIAWLGGTLVEICSAAVRLRILCPQIGILMQSDVRQIPPCSRPCIVAGISFAPKMHLWSCWQPVCTACDVV